MSADKKIKIKTEITNLSNFTEACQQMELLLNKHIRLSEYSNCLHRMSFTFSLPKRKKINASHLRLINDEAKVYQLIKHPYFDKLEEDELHQIMVEELLETIFSLNSLDDNFEEYHFYNDVKRVFYRYGWFTRVIFPAA